MKARAGADRLSIGLSITSFLAQKVASDLDKADNGFFSVIGKGETQTFLNRQTGARMIWGVGRWPPWGAEHQGGHTHLWLTCCGGTETDLIAPFGRHGADRLWIVGPRPRNASRFPAHETELKSH